MLQNLIHALARRSYELHQYFMGQAQLELQTDVSLGHRTGAAQPSERMISR